jgi:hypothetical protein
MGSIYRRGAVYWVKYFRNGKPYRESSRSDKETDAKRLLRKRGGNIRRQDSRHSFRQGEI